jgi:hypothetical protein
VIEPRDVVGFQVLARCGPLGFVVDPARYGRPDEPELLVVRGGVSDALYYHVPLATVTSVAPGRQVLAIELGSADFSPQLRGDGSVDLHIG